ncbi:NAD-dependent epimerase/dehydratase family protein [Thermoactinospora rubra]|uniref:NAD-dependent epimerase/dehydratase family protein n=1 Tax=Thermoactinospora rubra TaxID=1088767 RepID=UPI001301DAC1|nr:NAD(P)-dependent oxidoreductase [Thermoactinospora rubra]
MTSIVTGSAGFIGRILTETLIARGEHVIGVDRRPQPPRPGLTVLTADLLDEDELVRAAFESADAVYHLAGCPGVRDDGPGVAWRRHRDNVLAGARVLALTPRGVPLLVCSSSSVYGGARHGRPSREDDELRPIGGYARSKVALEELCRGRAVTVVRPFTVAGEGQRPDMALSIWLEAARRGRPLRILGSLERTRDVTDVRQAARAMADLIGIPGAVNVGTGRGVSLRAMVAAVAEVTGAEVTLDVRPAPPVEPGDSLADTRLLRSLIGWTPETDLLDVVRRQAEAPTPADVCARRTGTPGREGAATEEWAPDRAGAGVGGGVR